MKNASANANKAHDAGLHEAQSLNVHEAIEHYFAVAQLRNMEDYKPWAFRPYWTADEATALALEKNPALINWHSVQPFIGLNKSAERYAAVRELILRAIRIEDLGEHIRPIEFVRWAKPRIPDFPNLLLTAVDDFQTSLEKQSRQSSWTNERNTLLLIIYAMARTSHFGYTPERNNSAATTIIKSIESIDGMKSPEHSVILGKIKEGERVANERKK